MKFIAQTKYSFYWKSFFWKEVSSKMNKNIQEKWKNSSNFQFYQNNGGTILAIGGKNFSLIASDTRFSLGMALPLRNTTRIIKICPNIVLATAGMFSDLFFLQYIIQKAIKNFKIENSSFCLVVNCAFYLSYILYCRRFFPYYSFNILAGLELNREGCVYNFDAIGSFEKSIVSCVGNGQSQIQPLLDGIFQKKSLSWNKDFLSIRQIKKLIKDIYLKISRRNISIGDGLQIFMVTKKGIFVENSFLKLD